MLKPKAGRVELHLSGRQLAPAPERLAFWGTSKVSLIALGTTEEEPNAEADAFTENR